MSIGGATRQNLVHGLTRLTLALLVTLGCSAPAAALKRVALVVGNGAYAHVPLLANPLNDAADVVTALRQLDFDVLSGINVDRTQFTALLKQFADTIAPGDETVFFYAGHGLQAKGINYLIPVDARLRTESDLEQEAVSLDLALRQMQRAGTKVVLLDACRDNPFAPTPAPGQTRSLAVSVGLAVSTAAELGTFIAYSTQPGNVALDGVGRNSPFTDKLKAHMATTGQSITDLMMVVRNEVATVTNGAQIPWEHSALARKFYFRPGTLAAVDTRGQRASEAAEAWSWIRNSGNPAMLDEFIRRFPDTPFAAQAQTARATLKANKPDVVATAIPNIANVSLRQVQPSFDCRVHYLDAEVTICNNAELTILDNEISRLYTTALQGRGQTRRRELALEQRQWVETRNACGTRIDCLIGTHQQRIAHLTRTARAAPSPVAKAKPSFDCATHVLPAEIAVCADGRLARLDVELDRRYGELAGNLSAERRRALGVEQRQWLVARDTCASDRPCLSLQYRARIGQIQSWR